MYKNKGVEIMVDVKNLTMEDVAKVNSRTQLMMDFVEWVSAGGHTKNEIMKELCKLMEEVR